MAAVLIFIVLLVGSLLVTALVRIAEDGAFNSVWNFFSTRSDESHGRGKAAVDESGQPSSKFVKPKETKE